jgi:hypothetical protein
MDSSLYLEKPANTGAKVRGLDGTASFVPVSLDNGRFTVERGRDLVA